MTRRDGSKRRPCAQVTALTPGRVLPSLLQAIVPPAKHPPPCLGPRRAGVQLTALSVPSPFASNLAHANCVGGNPSVFDRSAGGALRESCRCFVARSRPLFQRSFPGPSLLRHLSPGRRNRPKDRNAGPGTMLQALSFPDARGKGFLEAPQGARAALYWGSILAPLTPRKRGKHGNQGKPRKARKST